MVRMYCSYKGWFEIPCVGVAMQLSMTLQRLTCLQLCRLQQLFTNYSINLCAEYWNKNDFIVAS